MANKDTTRSRFRRKAKEQWLKHLTEMRGDLAQFTIDYAEGSDNNQRQSLEMVLVSEMIGEIEKAIYILLEEI